jgi:uncharacterized membrane protein
MLATSIVTVVSVSDDDLRINRVVIDNEYNVGETRDVVARVNLENLGNANLEDVKLTITVPELGLRRSVGPFSIDEDERVLRNVVLEMVEHVQPGEYYVKIEARSGDLRKTKYRLITVE